MVRAWIACLLVACGTPAPSAPPGPDLGTLRLHLRDASGAPLSGRVTLWLDGEPTDPVGLRGTLGWRVRRQDFAEGGGERSILVGPDSELALPPGRVRLVVSRGQAWRAEDRELTLSRGADHELSVTLARWSDRRARGWRCGDLHLHLARLHPERDAPIRQLLEAEDLEVAALVDWSGRADGFAPGWGGWAWTAAHLAEPAEGAPLIFAGQGWGRPDRACVLALFGHRTPVSGTSLHSPPAIIEGVLAEGGIATGTMGDLPPAAAVLGRAVATEVLSHGRMEHLESWYALLDAGARVAAVAGSDTQGPPWPDTLVDYHAPPGASRVCARLDGEPSRERFLSAIASGHTFVTSGPTLELEVDGRGPGAILQGPGERRVTARLAAPSPPGGALELVIDGEVARRAAADSAEMELTLTRAFDRTSWIAARLVGEARMPASDLMLAHTSPVYVRIEGAPPDRAAREAILAQLPDDADITDSGRSTAREREVALRWNREARATLSGQ